jgi:hypothetical protein
MVLPTCCATWLSPWRITTRSTVPVPAEVEGVEFGEKCDAVGDAKLRAVEGALRSKNPSPSATPSNGAASVASICDAVRQWQQSCREMCANLRAAGASYCAVNVI